jgi:hypothetical protein
MRVRPRRWRDCKPGPQEGTESRLQGYREAGLQCAIRLPFVQIRNQRYPAGSGITTVTEKLAAPASLTTDWRYSQSLFR